MCVYAYRCVRACKCVYVSMVALIKMALQLCLKTVPGFQSMSFSYTNVKNEQIEVTWF